jgi:hypothetical protein
MKTSHFLLAAAALASGLYLAFGQGSLTPPPGPPAPTMKTLDRIEPRIDLATVAGNANYEIVINAPGSYYLSNNLGVTKANGIHIAATDVTVDLLGFQIARNQGGSGGWGILIDPTAARCTVKNGAITGFGFGIDFGASGDVPSGGSFQHADGTENLVICNNASGNTANYPIVAGNTVGPFVGVSSPITNTNPWANFSF